MSFPEILKSERVRLGLTGAEAAALLDVPARTYWDWERGLTTPPAVAQEGSSARLARLKPRSKKL